MVADDRIQVLQDQSRVTGIDFIYVHTNQVHLDVYFLRSPASLDTPLVGDLLPERIHIYSQSTLNQTTKIPIISLNWTIIEGRNVLQIETEYPGDFSLHTLFIEDARIDNYFNQVTFSFKANCPSDLDCKPPPHECPPEEVVDFPINYQARDFWSFRQALFDFASQRYPDWEDRLEADVGVMLAELMSALGDEMAYYQDRVAREAYLQTATQRRSIKHHARLVDYEMHDGAGASVWMNIQVNLGVSAFLSAGMDFWAAGDNGLRVDFELGRNLEENINGKTYLVTADRNELDPHCWDEDDLCLPVGTIKMYLSGHHEATLLPFDDEAEGRKTGKWVLLQTNPDPSLPSRNHLVRLISVQNLQDEVFNVPITRITWEQEQALPFELDMTVLKIHANILPATAGKTYEKLFIIGEKPESLNSLGSLGRSITSTVARQGRGSFPMYLFSLPDSELNPLTWLPDEFQQLKPEVHLVEYDLATETEIIEGDWTWRRSLIGDFSSQAQNKDFTLESGTWKRVVGYQRLGKEIIHQDYATDAGHSIRFGDGEFGVVPVNGTIFKITYRLGNGRRTNVPIGAVNHFTDSTGGINYVRNPLPGFNGLDKEPLEQVRKLAPEAYKAVTYRAVRPEDYAEAAERLSWVQKAGAEFRWTGSWLTAFVTADPLEANSLNDEQQLALTQQLDRFRQAGRDVIVPQPRYANMDIEITICVSPTAYQGEVKAQVLKVLLGKKGIRPKSGFFSPDNFTFGTPLQRSSLEASIQNIEGVRAIERIRFRRRQWFNWRDFKSMTYYPGKNAIIRLENNFNFPEKGTLKLKMIGGA